MVQRRSALCGLYNKHYGLYQQQAEGQENKVDIEIALVCQNTMDHHGLVLHTNN